ncbi:MAG: hypothetical protein Q9M50_06105 [Methylococcales bacterium]|nr:hypothetical protein [Methylococcales bacterium]
MLDFQEVVNECLLSLKSLNTQQQMSVNDNFNIIDALHYLEMKTYKESLDSEALLCFYATHLFCCETTDLTFKHTRQIVPHCAEVIFTTKEQTLKSFFIKHAWEGAIKEGIGIEFNNLLTDTPIRYLCSNELIITEKLFDVITPRQVYTLRDTPEYLFAFGAWEVFTRILHLTDRKTGNIRWNGQRLANIDFGLVFYRGKLVFDSRFTLTEPSQERTAGQRYALEWIHTKLQQPKVQQLLLTLDSKFCHNLTCHRNPAPPLRLMINVLQDNFCQ